ncbi:hypothetical protein LXL04_013233 [Taraxacum kok-saghyz]
MSVLGDSIVLRCFGNGSGEKSWRGMLFGLKRREELSKEYSRIGAKYIEAWCLICSVGISRSKEKERETRKRKEPLEEKKEEDGALWAVAHPTWDNAGGTTPSLGAFHMIHHTVKINASKVDLFINENYLKSIKRLHFPRIKTLITHSFFSPPVDFLSQYAIPLSIARVSAMETAGDGATPYQSGVPWRRLWRKTIRRSVQAAPYDQPPTALRKNIPSLVPNLLHPPSRPIYAGDDRSFGKCEEAEPSTDKGGNLELEASFNTLRLEASTKVLGEEPLESIKEPLVMDDELADISTSWRRRDGGV